MKCAEKLRTAEIENEAAESWFLMEYACKISRSFYLLHEQEEMPEDQWQGYEEICGQRCRHIPLQHLTGEQEFMGLPFRVNEHVLIPRQDTEVLVEEVLGVLKTREDAAVLDLCTGSGCIAVSLKSYCPDISVTAADISGQALQVAEENARENQTEIHFVQSDLFANLPDRYDLIVSNPPYIPSAVIPTLMPEVRDHEPMGALDGMEDGLFFYREIIKQSKDHLQPDGQIFFEIGHDQGEAVSQLLRAQDFCGIKIIRDLAGLDRVVTGRRK